MMVDMKLKEYLKNTGITGSELAIEVGVWPSAISQYKKFKRRPEPDIALRIVKATKGQVSLSDLYSSANSSEAAST